MHRNCTARSAQNRQNLQQHKSRVPKVPSPEQKPLSTQNYPDRKHAADYTTAFPSDCHMGVFGYTGTRRKNYKRNSKRA